MYYTSENLLEEHKLRCKKNTGVKVIMPQEGDKIKFNIQWKYLS